MTLISEAFRRKSNLLLARALETVAPLLRATARRRCGPARPPREWRRVLILGDNHLGDVLYRTCSLGPLKERLPNCEFYYLAAPVSAPLLENNPALSGVLPFARGDSRLHLAPAAVERLTSLRFDGALCSNAVHHAQDLRLALRLRIPARAAYVFKGLSGLVTHPVVVKWPSSFPCYFQQMVAHLTESQPDWPLRPRVFPSATDCQIANELWARLRLPANRPTLVCFMTSRQPTGVWPIDCFVETLRLVQRRTLVNVVLAGAASDEPVLRKADADAKLQASVCVGMPISCVVPFLKNSSAVLSTDSGPRHLANAAGVPVVFVRNLWFNPVEAGRYATTDHDMAPQVGELTPAEEDRWLRKVAPAAVAERILQLVRAP